MGSGRLSVSDDAPILILTRGCKGLLSFEDSRYKTIRFRSCERVKILTNLLRLQYDDCDYSMIVKPNQCAW